ncbi:hypothetical protein FRACYDRAFT_275647 [Fragilariopsis cylindrus CCMP1102]|uniref:CID domain-containing protein n=1 Tax=Fragilariopsis cylindrus CCMP1102 TaxID=635003 RepID=A0A1E7FB59_9STRA|nr:hypothetical protein FRACYDRAFT_275647 [Fragilariopsis cylindrus CCMP1102]|eukprot:OEU15377.1 hypothetical protein FRACYDRAFT_275647 [Fragilariopsis cylindrus CCMP1102]
MSSSWGKKLEKKLKALADTASKESIQTLANWIAFNRKHASTLVPVLINALLQSKNNTKRQWVCWQLVHGVLVMERENSSKWGKLSELRVALGEALQPAMESLGSTMPDQLDKFLQEWEDYNVFEGPSLLSQIRRLYQNKNNQTETDITKPKDISSQSAISRSSVEETTKPAEPTTAEPAATTTSTTVGDESCQSKKDDADQKDQTINHSSVLPMTSAANTSSDDVSNQKQQKDDDAIKTISATKSPSPQKRNSFSHLNQPVEYDFESKGIPPGKVESREFLDPCKAITTLQIARDVRTNTAVEISTAMANLPEDIIETCKDLKSGQLKELDTAMTNEFSIRIPSVLIDMDINEESSNLNMYQDIVQRQQKAREKLIYLLLKSRCQFGSTEAARDFYEIDNVAENLKKRKEKLSDALELEGLDTTETTNKNSQQQEQELAPLTWYKPDNDDDDDDDNKSEEIDQKIASIENKKQRTA